MNALVKPIIAPYFISAAAGWSLLKSLQMIIDKNYNEDNVKVYLKIIIDETRKKYVENQLVEGLPLDEYCEKIKRSGICGDGRHELSLLSAAYGREFRVYQMDHNGEIENFCCYGETTDSNPSSGCLLYDPIKNHFQPLIERYLSGHIISTQLNLKYPVVQEYLSAFIKSKNKSDSTTNRTQRKRLGNGLFCLGRIPFYKCQKSIQSEIILQGNDIAASNASNVHDSNRRLADAAESSIIQAGEIRGDGQNEVASIEDGNATEPGERQEQQLQGAMLEHNALDPSQTTVQKYAESSSDETSGHHNQAIGFQITSTSTVPKFTDLATILPEFYNQIGELFYLLQRNVKSEQPPANEESRTVQPTSREVAGPTHNTLDVAKKPADVSQLVEKRAPAPLIKRQPSPCQHRHYISDIKASLVYKQKEK
ncbi:unnamed protein product [Didymodactylos carnosus]|uniref:Ubiquitin thioesterase OTU n=1 Tax=Didymodactylos carnosus TaxID=1234261 RepID=A0A8S2EGN6_9BILA|nr:unnamed protein product [Didymodactylos carnosus]CAF3944565.1 unnamed protein product [Didymodactylos carnosus]